MSEAKSIENLSYGTMSVGMIYILIGLLDGFYIGNLLLTEGEIPRMMRGAHSHFLCMSIIILIVGLAMTNWAKLIAEGKFTLTGGLLRSAQTSVVLLALGAIISFIFYTAQIPEPGMIGDILYFIGFLIVALGYILGGRKVK